MTSNSSVEAVVRGLRNATTRLNRAARTLPVRNDKATTREEKAEAYRAGLLDSILNHIRKAKEHNNE